MTLDATTKTKWFTNNWKWSLPLAIILLIAIVFFSIPDMAENTSDIAKAYTDDQLYAEAWKKAEANEKVQQVLGETHPKEWLYAIRMSEQLVEFAPDASEELRIAARAQHICRWKSPREDYPMDRPGYLRWREDLKKMHAKLTGEILEEVGYDSEFIKRVQFLIRKKQLKKDEGTQTLEDVICLVFLKYYFEDFAAKKIGNVYLAFAVSFKKRANLRLGDFDYRKNA